MAARQTFNNTRNCLKYSKLFLYQVAIVQLLSGNLALAEIKNCDGVITNQDCEGGKKVVDELPLRTPPPEAADLKRKQDLLRGLRLTSSKAKDDYGVDVDIRITETVCNMSSVEDCARVVVSKEREVNALVASAKLVKERRSELETLMKETQVEKADTKPSSNGDNTITVIQNRVVQNNTQINPPQATPITAPISTPGGIAIKTVPESPKVKSQGGKILGR